MLLPWLRTEVGRGLLHPFFPHVVVLALVGLVCVTTLGLHAWRSWTAREVQLQETYTSVANLTRSLAHHADSSLRQVDVAVAGVREMLEADMNGGMAQDPAAVRRRQSWLSYSVAQLPQVRRMTVVNAEGFFVTGSDSAAETPEGSSGREYFRFHRDNPSRALHIGRPLQARSDGTWFFALSLRLDDSRGRFAGVVLASINLEDFRNLYAQFDIGRQGVMGLIMDDGTFLVRLPNTAETYGLNIGKSELFQRYAPNAPSGTHEIASSQDGVLRILNYRRLAGYPILMMTALSKEEVLVQWRKDSYLHLAGTVMALVCLVLASLLMLRLLRQMNIRIRTEQDLRAAQRELDARNETLHGLAFRDSLTSLANRRLFDERLADELARARRSETAVALLLLDIDHFKLFNDRLGHAAGDECLAGVGRALRLLERRPGDLAARYGGEEFALILGGADLAGAMVVAENARRSIAALAMQHPGSPFGIVTVSVGVVCLEFVMPQDNSRDLIVAADAALYAAKASGRNQVHAGLARHLAAPTGWPADAERREQEQPAGQPL